MHADIAWRFFSVICLVVTVVFTVRLRRTKLVYILDYQTGLRYRDGVPCSVLPPGSYLTSASQDPITVVDMRPHHFIFERMVYQDVQHANSVMSVGGELLVRNPQLAVSTLKNLVADSLTIVREGLRLAASRSIVDPSPEGRTKLALTLIYELNRELETRGVEVRNLEITELWARPIKHSIPAEAN